jgi:hypothetical protein
MSRVTCVTESLRKTDANGVASSTTSLVSSSSKTNGPTTTLPPPASRPPAQPAASGPKFGTPLALTLVSAFGLIAPCLHAFCKPCKMRQHNSLYNKNSQFDKFIAGVCVSNRYRHT